MTGPAGAQDTVRSLIDSLPAQLATACAEGPLDCDAALGPVLERLDAAALGPEERASVVAALAGAVVSAAQGADDLEGYAGPMERLGAATPDTDQGAAIGELAAAFERGNPDEIADLEPVAASPN